MKKNKVNVWMITTFVLAGILIFIAGTFFPNLFAKKEKNSQTSAERLPVSPSPAPSKIATPSSILTLSPTVQTESDLLLIQKAFAKKYNRELSEVLVTVSQKDETHATGGIRFLGETSGGWFLAYKTVTDGWTIVQDGNGTISCETVAPYNFPQEMVPECVDVNGNLVK